MTLFVLFPSFVGPLICLCESKVLIASSLSCPLSAHCVFYLLSFFSHMCFTYNRPQYILQPLAWMKVLPPHFLGARQLALVRAHEYELANGLSTSIGSAALLSRQPRSGTTQFPVVAADPARYSGDDDGPGSGNNSNGYYNADNSGGMSEQQNFAPPFQKKLSPQDARDDPVVHRDFQRDVEEEGAFIDTTAPIDEAIATHAARATRPPVQAKMDPPDDEPPSLSKRSDRSAPAYQYIDDEQAPSVSTAEPSFDEGLHYYETAPEKSSAYYPKNDFSYEEEPESTVDYTSSQDEQPLSPGSHSDFLSQAQSADTDDPSDHKFEVAARGRRSFKPPTSKSAC
jgi:hypothetical protein